jgi:hypothetical protein
MQRKLHLLLSIDRTSKYAFARLHDDPCAPAGRWRTESLAGYCAPEKCARGPRSVRCFACDDSLCRDAAVVFVVASHLRNETPALVLNCLMPMCTAPFGDHQQAHRRRFFNTQSCGVRVVAVASDFAKPWPSGSSVRSNRVVGSGAAWTGESPSRVQGVCKSRNALKLAKSLCRPQLLVQPAQRSEAVALQPFHITWPVIDIGGRHELSTGLDAGDEQRRAVGARRGTMGHGPRTLKR